MPASAEPVFPRLGVVGTGLLGASLGLAARVAGSNVTGLDSNLQNLSQASELGALDQTATTLAELSSCDLIVIATPPATVADLVREAAEHCPESVITDVASVKGPLVNPLPAERFVPGHPMAGGEVAGPAHARADLFQGATWALCPENSRRDDVERVQSWVQQLGANPLRLSAAEHDRHVAWVSHLPHVLAAALLREFPNYEHQQMAGPSWRDLTRVGAADPGLWGQILIANREQTLAAIATFRAQLDTFEQAVEQGDEHAIRQLFQQSRAARKQP
ncbi:MAG: prephenate dehydrogenase [Fimbriimonadaceae bacterium]